MSVIEYNDLKYNVSQGIDWTTKGKRLLYICKTFLPDGSENNIQNVLSLLDKLEEENRLAIDNIAVLKDLLKQLDECYLLEMVEKFENKRKGYKSLLEQCGRVFHECGQLERLISVCEGKISQDRRGQITDVFNLFTELETQNNLGIADLEILKTMATEMEKPDLLQQIEEFDKKRIQEEDADRKRRKRQGEESTVFISNIKMYIINGLEILKTWYLSAKSQSNINSIRSLNWMYTGDWGDVVWRYYIILISMTNPNLILIYRYKIIAVLNTLITTC